MRRDDHIEVGHDSGVLDALAPEREAVLLVDDDPVARVLTASVLESHGLCVFDVESGIEALERFEQIRPHCVVLDALMPGIDGFETCLRLRKLDGGSHVPVLMLTGLEDEESVTRAYEVGATDFFVKSQQWTLLAQRVRYLLRSSRMRIELEKSRSRLAKAQSLARLGSWEWDVKSRAILASSEVYRMLGLHELEHKFDEPLFLMHVLPEDRELLLQTIIDICRDQRGHAIELRLRRADGEVITVHCEGEVEKFEDNKVTKVSGTIQDISQRKEAELQIRALASYDPLTKLPNRRLFSERFSETIAHARQATQRVALLFIDLDRFKHINDTQGHVAGDTMLIDVAQRLIACVRQRGTAGRDSDVVARLGGDEFVVLLNEMGDVRDAEVVADRILNALRLPFVIRGNDNYIGASIGIARYPDHGDNTDTLIQSADAAMYAVKSSGRNGVKSYSPEMTMESRRRWAIETDLHKAIERQELVLYFQPQVDVRTGRLVGAEALMRWNRGGQLVPPNDFIGIAQECGLIIPMGEWAVWRTAHQIREWRDAGLGEMQVAVNISSSHFTRADLCATVKRVSEETGVRAGLIEIEITETVLMQDLALTTETLFDLTRMGVKLSVDDFGTGYSSLAYLKRFPISELKIDRSFVHGLAAGSENEAIVSAIIAMARSLQLEVVAEGVETAEEVALLHRAGCHIMQGYYFGKPVAAEEFGRLMAEENRDGRHEKWVFLGRNKVVGLPRPGRATVNS